MSVILILFTVLNLLIAPISMAFATEAQSPMKIEVVSYKIGDRVIETTSSTDENIAVMEPKVMTTQGRVKPMTMSESSGMPRPKIMSELSDQPVINIKSELSADKEKRKIILKINIENIGSVKAKNVKATTESTPMSEVLYVKGGKVSAKEATWAGEIDSGKSQELVYEFLCKGNVTEDLTIPLSITGSGSDDWILDIIFTIFLWWLKLEFGIEIPGAAPASGFDIVLGISSIAVIFYITNKKYKKS